ncbi:EamA family transporter RarD [Microbacterium halophytorum]|uniref:EamA family transporter RarD n=1 Tax=Microbacterium halophytorum TaxID=2067568 RepID=UPI000CFAC9D5|nr:EamA family transporter RarD [Microbacterium halophytorum]
MGTGYGAGAYLLWGFLPLYFVLLAPTGPWEVLAWRVLLSLALCAILVTITRGWRRFALVVTSPRLVWWTVLAGALIYVNWQVFLIAAQTGQVLQASLGYFINPIITVLLAVIFLRERPRPLQWAAIGVAAVAVGVIVAGYGAVPYLALAMALSFGFYGLVKHRIGPAVDAIGGLALETLWLAPVAVAQLVIVALTTGLTYGTAGIGHTVALSFAGVVTTVPLLLFAAGSRRVPLSTMGMLQFIAPILQFITGVFLLGEEMPLERLIGFALVWVACALLIIDIIRAARRDRASRRSAHRDAHPVTGEIPPL